MGNALREHIAFGVSFLNVIPRNGVVAVVELLQSMSDDQTALLGCGAAFIGATLMLVMSFHANPNNKQTKQTQQGQGENTTPVTIEEDQRRAA